MASKISQQEAKYTKFAGQPAKICGWCSMFRVPHSCTLVEGRISSIGVCKYWEFFIGGRKGPDDTPTHA